MKVFRIFVNDVGRNGYSGYGPSRAESAAEALRKVHCPGVRCYAVLEDPESLERYGPDGQTGALPAAHILQRGRAVGVVAGPSLFDNARRAAS